jgi:Dopey, N-terminal
MDQGKFNKAIELKLKVIEKNSSLEWPELKTWLESFLTMIIEHNQTVISDRHVLRISKIFIRSLSPSIPDPIHNLCLNIFQIISSYCSATQAIILAFGILPHIKYCSPNNLTNFISIINDFRNRYHAFKPLSFSLVFCMLNGMAEHGEKNQMVKACIEAFLEQYPVMTEDLLWVYVLKTHENHVPVLKILKELKRFNSCSSLYIKPLVAGLTHTASKVRRSCIDSFSKNFLLDDENETGVKVVLLKSIFYYINDSSIFMRLSNWIPDDINDTAFKTLFIAVEGFLDTQNRDEAVIGVDLLYKLKGMEKLHESFFCRTSLSFIKYLYRHQSYLNSHSFQMIEAVFGKDNYECLWKGIEASLESGLSGSQEELWQGLLLSLKILKNNTYLLTKLQNRIHELIVFIQLSPSFFDVCSALASVTSNIPTNFHVFIDLYDSMLPISLHKDIVLSYFNCFFSIKKKFNNISIACKINPLDFEDNYDFLFTAEIFICNRIELKTRLIRRLWSLYDDFKSLSSGLLAESVYCKKSWEKAAIKQLVGPSGIIKFTNFCEYWIKNSECIKEFFTTSSLFHHILQRINPEQGTDIYLKNLISALIMTLPCCLDYILQELSTPKDLKKPDTKNTLNFLYSIAQIINTKVVRIMKDYKIGYNLKRNLEHLSKPKITVESYFDYAILISYRYLLLQDLDLEINLSAYELLLKISSLTPVEDICKVIEIACVYYKSSKTETKNKTQILNLINSLNISQKLELSKYEHPEKILSQKNLISFIDSAQDDRSLKAASLNIFFSLVPYYLKFSFGEEIVEKVIKACVSMIIANQDFFLLVSLKEILYSVIGSGYSLIKIPEILFNEQYNLFEVMVLGYKCRSNDHQPIRDIKELLCLISKECNSFFAEELINYILHLYKSNRQEDLKIVYTFIPCFEITMNSILQAIDKKISHKNFWIFSTESESERNYKIIYLFEFLESFIIMHESDIKSFEKSEETLNKILEHMKLNDVLELFVIGIYIVYVISKLDLSKEFRENLKNALEKTLKNVINGALGSKNTCKKLEYTLIKLTKPVRTSKLASMVLQLSITYKVISWVWAEKTKRLDFISSLLSFYLKSLPTGKHSSHFILDTFYRWVQLEPTLYTKLKPQLIDLYSSPKFPEITEKFPKVWFRVGQLLNLCDSHTKLFEDFHKIYSPKSKSLDQKLQERAKMLYMHGYLIYTSNYEDYKNPEILKVLSKEIEFMMDLDLYFGLSCLLIGILHVRTAPEDFDIVFRRVWGGFYAKMQEVKQTNDVWMHSNILKLIDLLLASGYTKISYLNYNNPLKYNENRSCKTCILKDINPTNMEEIRFHSISLIKQFNQYHSECDPLDTLSVQTTIEKEFMRLKHIIN